MKQVVVTSAMGKRLIARGILAREDVRAASRDGTIVVVAGSTNGYVAEGLLAAAGQAEGFTRTGFRRGVVLPPGMDPERVKADFPGDVVLVRGRWRRGKTIFDVADDLGAGDIILKGANALDLSARAAGVLIGHPVGGTTIPALAAAAGRGVRIIIPVGLEKRIGRSIFAAAADANAAAGPGMLPLTGEVFTELEAVALLTGATARLVAAGGVHGAEGAVWLALDGDDRQVAAAEALIADLAGEPPCRP